MGVKVNPKVNLNRKKTIPMVGAPVVKKKPVVNKKPVLKNKNIVDTKMKNVVPMVTKKVRQKIKNIKNSTPKELVKKSINAVTSKVNKYYVKPTIRGAKALKSLYGRITK